MGLFIMKPILIKTIPHRKQRLHNSDIADYFELSEKTVIAVSDLGDDRYNLLVMLHEMVELFLITKAGIPIAEIDKWDCAHPKEMGDHPFAPYHKFHVMATAIERFAAKQLGISWRDYEQTIERM